MTEKPVLEGEYTVCLGVGGDTVALWIKCPSATHADIQATKIMQQIKDGHIEIKLPDLEIFTH
jgi:hypothetical protein